MNDNGGIGRVGRGEVAPQPVPMEGVLPRGRDAESPESPRPMLRAPSLREVGARAAPAYVAVLALLSERHVDFVSWLPQWLEAIVVTFALTSVWLTVEGFAESYGPMERFNRFTAARIRLPTWIGLVAALALMLLAGFLPR